VKRGDELNVLVRLSGDGEEYDLMGVLTCCLELLRIVVHVIRRNHGVEWEISEWGGRSNSVR
jgi:hypothetical protein